MKGYIVTNAWAGKAVCKDEFQSCLSTEKFTVTGKEWALAWSIKSGCLEVSVKGADSSESHNSALSVSASQNGQGIKYLEGPGNFSLEISASGDWAVKVVLVEEVRM
jgi:hypothetical protein